MTILVPDTATSIDVEIHQGETWLFDFEVVDLNGAPVPTTGFAVKAIARSHLDVTTPPFFTWDSTAGSAAAAAGTATSVRLITTSAQTAAFTWRTAVYDVRVIDTLAKTSYIAKGMMTVIAASTY